MSRPIRIGLIAEGETELGASVPYIKPEAGGKVIDRSQEGALHNLIRRELEGAGLPSCDFVQRHPTFKETFKFRTGHSILDPKYLAQVVSVWKAEEIDMVVIVVDADDILEQRQKDLEKALSAIRANHLDINEQPSDRSTGGLAIRDFETWLLADAFTLAKIWEVTFERQENLEGLENSKELLEKAIAGSSYLCDPPNNQRPLQMRWDLAALVDLALIRKHCPTGYGRFAISLRAIAEAVVQDFTT
jgi:Domain of unknown function (DUF4276)